MDLDEEFYQIRDAQTARTDTVLDEITAEAGFMLTSHKGATLKTHLFFRPYKLKTRTKTLGKQTFYITE